MGAEPAADDLFRHEAAFYRDAAGYRSAVLPFVREGLDQAESVLVAVPAPAAKLIREGLDGQRAAAHGVGYADMTELGRNPGRVISAIWDFAGRYPGRPVRFVSELAWPGRSDAEIGEVAVHEAMLNLAFSAGPVRLLCPYDAGLLAPGVIADAGLTHPFLRTASGVTASAKFGPAPAGPTLSLTLPPPPAGADRLTYTTDLRAVRSFVAVRAEQAGLSPDRTADLVLAVGEVAANTVRHASARGTLLVWRTGTEIICQVSDLGQIRDPLVGRRRPPETGSLGLWVVHQVCDLVELRSGPGGTVVRMHMLLDGGPAMGGRP
jgi:anti-sigma regulatory factor (Ser/Thr protein kinase)